MTGVDREALRAAAEAAAESEAGGGHWEPYPLPEAGQHRWTMTGVGIAGDREMGHRTETMFPVDAAHIAAADPDTVLALLDALDAAEARLAAVEALAEHVGALHAALDEASGLQNRRESDEWGEVGPGFTWPKSKEPQGRNYNGGVHG